MNSLPAHYFNFDLWLKRQLLLVPLLTICFTIGMLLPIDNSHAGFGGPVLAASKSIITLVGKSTTPPHTNVFLAQVTP